MSKININSFDEDDFYSDDLNQHQEKILKRPSHKNTQHTSKKPTPKKQNPFNDFPIPTSGDIVLCYYPEREDPTQPGPKARPCIVLAETKDENGDSILHLVAGTSKKLDRLFPHEIIVKSSDMPFDDATSGLRVDTKFDISRLVQVPYSEKWLMGRVSKNELITPVIGKLNNSERMAICNILDRVKSQLVVHDNATPKNKRKHTSSPS